VKIMVALFVVLTIVAFLVADAIILAVKRRRAAAFEPTTAASPLAELLPEPAMPSGVFLAPSHMWVGLLPSGEARLGLDALVRSVLGEPDSIDALADGTKVRKGEPLFVGRWGKRSVVFHAPLDGTVLSTSQQSEGAEGWLVRLNPSHAWADLSVFPMAEEAKRWFSREWARVREFVGTHAMPAAVTALPDGGTPMPGWLQREPDATWDGFVDAFLKG
jgi:glycine cleavage system H lipoate-binding protein